MNVNFQERDICFLLDELQFIWVLTDEFKYLEVDWHWIQLAIKPLDQCNVLVTGS
jgi:hypothetical protein